MSKKIQTEFEQWKTKSQKKLAEDWFEEVTLEAETNTVTFSVDLDYSETFQAATLIVPESYPKGMYNLCFLETISEFKAENLAAALDKCIKEFENHREALLEATPPTSKSHVEDDIFDEPAHEIIIDDDTVDESKTRIEESIRKDIEKVQKTKGWFAELGACSPEQIRIYLFLDPQERLGISDLVASAWRIDLDKYITIALTFSGFYLDTNSTPTVDAYQSGTTSSSKFRIDSKIKFGLYWTVEQRLREDFFKRNWPIENFNRVYASKGLNYMQVLLQNVEEVIKQSPGKCIICGSSMPFVGIKPTVCEKNLCIFSHEQYGLGIDLESAIKKEPDLVDLMISMTYSASEVNPSSRYNPFNPFPYVEVKVKNMEKGIIETHNCLTSEGKPDNYKCKELLEKLPSVSKMSKWVEEGKLKDNLDKVNPLLYSLLRWIMASNRSHLKKMTPSEQIAVVKTDHQYLLMSSPPEKEKKFQELKKQYGSFHAWHGSALCNWHSIMRIGLKNMSGTAGQVNGAAYGSGIYLAENSSVSFGYMRYQTSWKQSVFGSSNVGCLALCEVVNHPCLKGMPNPYYVVSDENLVQTRYFFVYTGGGGSVNVSGKSIKVPSLKFN